MPAKTTKPGRIYQIKVTLLGTKPPIWRRLLIPAEMKLDAVHAVLQRAMGWYDCHLHEFRVGERSFGARDPGGDPVDSGDTADESKVRLSQILGRAGAKARYSYDFGDGWEHNLVLEKILPAEPGQAYPRCIAGKRACPPEDCGGAWGYYDMLEALQDPEHERHEELLEWLGGGFDPDAFSVEEANSALGG